MFTEKLVFLAALGVAATLIFSRAHAGNIDPLHPSYVRDKSVELKSGAASVAVPYVVSTNPLHPMFGAGTPAKWVGAVIKNSVAYVDARNPLHPSHER